MSDTTEQEIIVLEPSNNDHNLSDEIVQHEPAAQKFNYKNLIPKIDTIVKTDDSIDGELVKNISSEYSPEQQLLQKMDEMKMEPDEVIAVPKLVDLFNAINKYDYATVRAGLASDEVLKMQSVVSQKISVSSVQTWIPVKSSLLHGALRIAQKRRDISLYDFIIELIDMGANTNLTDAENKTAFDIYAEQFMPFDFKKFTLKDNNLVYRLSLQVLKKLAEKHCNQSSNSYQFYESFMEKGATAWDGFGKEAELLYNETDCIPQSPFLVNSWEFVDTVTVDDLFYFLRQPFEESLQQTLYCSYFYGKIELTQKDRNGDDILMKLINGKASAVSDQTIQLLDSYSFDFRTLYKVGEKQMTMYGVLSDKVQETETKNRRDGSNKNYKKVELKQKVEVKQLKIMLPKMKTTISDALESKPDTNIQTLFNAEIVNYEKYEEKFASDSIFEERIVKLEGRIQKLETENNTVTRSESDLKAQVKRLESRVQNQENRLRSQESRMQNMDRDIANLRRMVQTQSSKPDENVRPVTTPKSTTGGSLTPNRGGSLTPSRTVVKSPNQQKTKSPNTLMPSRPRT